jgi:hypothetical protein
MSQITFHWQASEQTPELLTAVGLVTLTWARIDWTITNILELFWRDNKAGQPMPRSFDQRIAYLEEFLTPLYHTEPDELRTFLWYLQRLKTANGNRDDVAHGIVGKITKGSRTYSGLMVPFPSKETKYPAFNLDQIKKLGRRLEDLETETAHVSSALREVREASLPNIRVWRDPDGWLRPTMENRTRRLPRKHLPPPTFLPSLRTDLKPPTTAPASPAHGRMVQKVLVSAKTDFPPEKADPQSS